MIFLSEVFFGLGVFCEAFEARLTFAWDVGYEVGEWLVAVYAFMGFLLDDRFFHGVCVCSFTFKFYG
jgi:hypothetical protein